MSWPAQLSVQFSHDGQRSLARAQHTGPLRVLKSLYPEGAAICHQVLVHPPGGLVGGDTLAIELAVGAGAHGLVTTPGATRFYRCAPGLVATQTVHAQLEPGARLEWLPLETLAYSGCTAVNTAHFALAPGAELLAWDITALGLPAADQPFVAGSLAQHLEIAGVWLERGTIAAADTHLLDSPLGLAGHRCLGTLFFAAGSALAPTRIEAALHGARTVIAAHALQHLAGVTCPNPQVLVLRLLAPVVEPASHLLRLVWAVWRAVLWGLPGTMPRTWQL